MLSVFEPFVPLVEFLIPYFGSQELSCPLWRPYMSSVIFLLCTGDPKWVLLLADDFVSSSLFSHYKPSLECHPHSTGLPPLLVLANLNHKRKYLVSSFEMSGPCLTPRGPVPWVWEVGREPLLPWIWFIERYGIREVLRSSEANRSQGLP